MAYNKRERYLKFLARLYDLASEFDQQQLLDVQHTAKNDKNSVVAATAALLGRLRGDDTGTVDPARMATDRGDDFRELLSSRKIFPSNAGLASFVRGYVDLPIRPKDSRDRIVARILRVLEEGTEEEVAAFQKALEDYVAQQTEGSDFVSRWTKIIRGL